MVSDNILYLYIQNVNLCGIFCIFLFPFLHICGAVQSSLLEAPGPGGRSVGMGVMPGPCSALLSVHRWETRPGTQRADCEEARLVKAFVQLWKQNEEKWRRYGKPVRTGLKLELASAWCKTTRTHACPLLKFPDQLEKGIQTPWQGHLDTGKVSWLLKLFPFTELFKCMYCYF